MTQHQDTEPNDFTAAIGRWLEQSRGRREQYPFDRRDAAALAELEQALEELQVSQEELRVQNEEIQAVDRELEAQRQRYQELFDFAPDAYFVTDGLGVIERANRAAAALVGVAPQFLEGKPLAVFLPDAEKNAFRAQLERLNRLERVSEWEIVLRTRSGESVPIAISAASASTAGGSTEIRWLVRDVTDRRRADEASRRLEWERAARQASESAHARAVFLAQSSRTLAQCVSFDEAARAIPRLAVPALGDYCILDWLEDDGRIRRLAFAHAGSEGTEALAPPHDQSLAEHLEDVRHAIDSGETEVMDRGRSMLAPGGAGEAVPDARNAAAQVVIVPLHGGGRVIGALTIGRAADSADPNPLPLAESFTDRAALALEHALLYDEAEAARRTAEAANEAKAAFLAALSHEIRTPLSSCLGYVELMLAGIPEPLPDALVRHARGIQSSVRHQLGLVEDILQFARVEAGTEEVRLGDVDIVALTEEVAGVMGRQVEAEGLRFELETPRQPLTMVTDAGKLRQILMNLLTNAIRFTEQGVVRLSLKTEDGHARFEVADTGVGIPSDQVHRIFDRFWRGQALRPARSTGVGLGLAITRQLVSLLGGTIDVFSEVGVGTTFRVRLPV